MTINLRNLKNFEKYQGVSLIIIKLKLKLKGNRKLLQQENFWKDKSLAKKTIKQKKIFEDIVNSYKENLKEITNIKDFII